MSNSLKAEINKDQVKFSKHMECKNNYNENLMSMQSRTQCSFEPLNGSQERYILRDCSSLNRSPEHTRNLGLANCTVEKRNEKPQTLSKETEQLLIASKKRMEKLRSKLGSQIPNVTGLCELMQSKEQKSKRLSATKKKQ